jgi:peptidyl-prolyl cis-trans isomerase SurA
MMGVATAGAQTMMSSHAPSASIGKPAQPTTAVTAANALPPAVANKPALTMTPAMQVTGKTVARVNGVELSDRELLREMFAIFPYANQHNGFPKDLEPEIRRGALDMIIFDELLYQEAKRRNITVSPEKLAAAEKELKGRFPNQAAYQEFLKTEANGSQAALREMLRRGIMVETLTEKEVTVPARVTTAQVKAQYEKNIAQYKHGEVLHIQSISIVPPDQSKAVLSEAKQRAEDAAKQAKQAKSYRDFGLLAEKFSDDDFHVNMGDHKPQSASSLPPQIVQAAAKMKPGDVSDLIQIGNNYTIFRLDSRAPAGTMPFAEVKTKLQADMQKQKTEQLRSALAQKLAQNAKIEKL